MSIVKNDNVNCVSYVSPVHDVVLFIPEYLYTAINLNPVKNATVEDFVIELCNKNSISVRNAIIELIGETQYEQMMGFATKCSAILHGVCDKGYDDMDVSTRTLYFSRNSFISDDVLFNTIKNKDVKDFKSTYSLANGSNTNIVIVKDGFTNLFGNMETIMSVLENIVNRIESSVQNDVFKSELAMLYTRYRYMLVTC